MTNKIQCPQVYKLAKQGTTWTQHLKPIGLIGSDHAKQVTKSIEMKGEVIVSIIVVGNHSE